MTDRAAQEAATRAQWNDMRAQAAVPAHGMIDLHFTAGPQADATEFMGWLEDRGYDVEHYPAEDDEAEVVEVQTDAGPLTLDRVLEQERRCTDAAERFGFVPSGWGVMGV